MKKASRLYRFLKKCETPPDNGYFWLMMNFLFNMAMIILGRMLLRSIIEKKRCYVLFSTMSMGDVLLLYRSLSELEKENDFSDSILIVSPVLKQTVLALGISNLIILPYWKIMAMSKAVLFSPNKYDNIVISTPWYFFDIRNIKQDSYLKKIPCTASQKTLQKLFPDLKMKGNSVILAPYEQSFFAYGEKKLPVEFWEELATELKLQGKYVFTNCDGINEKPIEGTYHFFPQLKDLAGAVEYAGFCVVLCSGFSDWVSSAKLKKEIVLYPSHKYYVHFNRQAVWGKDSVWEKIYSKDENLTELVREVIFYFGDKNGR